MRLNPILSDMRMWHISTPCERLRVLLKGILKNRYLDQWPALSNTSTHGDMGWG